ncbi:MAG: NAD-dependent epimerase/dehydratase family protein [Planctomycetes bacterium]|nr:NAD-dependent epimerase/dehydratase family protein [Planctomycetota bacterium]
MKALVTGGGGFLGSRIVQMLHARGDEVVALGRGAYPHHELAGIRTMQADIRNAEAIRTACRGMDVVFHVAALPGIWGRRSEFREINVDGTRNVIGACQTCGVPKLVFTSSPSVVFGRDPLCGVDESQPYPGKYLAHYPETKAAAEQMVLAANGPGLATVALRPHLIWGPGDPHLIPRVIARARAGQLVQVGEGDNLVDITYIDNVAEAHLLAADALSPSSPCAGRTYFISQGEPVSLWPWLNDILRAVGAPEVNRRVSFRKAYTAGAACEAVYRVLGVNQEPPMSRFLASQLAHSHYFDISAAKHDIGYIPRVSVSEGLVRMIEHLNRGEVSSAALQ